MKILLLPFDSFNFNLCDQQKHHLPRASTIFHKLSSYDTERLKSSSPDPVSYFLIFRDYPYLDHQVRKSAESLFLDSYADKLISFEDAFSLSRPAA